jgi:hypothetical protein
MPAHRDGPACTGAGVRKHPEKETAGRGTYERAAGATAIHCRAQPAFVEACGNERAEAAALPRNPGEQSAQPPRAGTVLE